MTSIPQPAFSSPELQKVFDEVRPALEGADEARNRVSEDIKALEAYLQKLDLKTEFWFGLRKAFVADEGDQEIAASLEYGGSASGTVQEEFIAWAPDRNHKRRLLYERREWQGSIDIDVPGGPLFWDAATESREQSLPLIETKFDIRKRMHAQLATFLEALGREVNVSPSPFSGKFDLDDDIPF